MSELPEPELSTLPDWLRPLAAAARRVQPGDLSRFLPPDDGSGRASAVLMAVGLATVTTLLRRRDVAEVHTGDAVAVPA